MEQKQVAQSLLPILKQSRPSNLLVYGKPGTGKTLVVRKVLAKIQKKVELSNFPIRLLYANSKQETTLYGLLVSFGRQLDLMDRDLPSTGLAISEVFKRLLNTINKNRLNAIFVIDEIDYLAQLVSKTGKDVLYQLTRSNELLARGSLTLVGISNNLSFKENLDPRVISSLGEEEIVFTNYTVEQIHKILEERAEQAFVKGAVGEAALNLCAAMAGREHGDARRAIDLLRVAGEIAEREQKNEVTEQQIKDASQKIEENKEVTALKTYPLHEKLVILAVMRSAGSSTGEIYASYKNLCTSVRQNHLTPRRITQILSEIEMSGIISSRIIHQGTHGRTKKHRLTISADTVKKTFQDDLVLEDVL
jgi:cell division control protein 6